MRNRPTNKQLSDLMSQVDAQTEVDCVDSVMGKIKCGGVKMKNRWLVFTEYFGIRTTWVVLLIVLAFLINLTVFTISSGPEWEFTELGATSAGIIVEQLPYGWISLALGLSLFLVFTMRRFSSTYSMPFAVYTIILIGGVVFVGTATFASGINSTLYNKLVEEPGAGKSFIAKLFCNSANRALPNDALMGELLYQDNDFIFVQTPQLEIVKVKLNPETEWYGKAYPEIFQVIKMVGKRDNDVFLASSVVVDENKQIALNRDKEDCVNKEKWEHKNMVLELRRELIQLPMSQSVNHVEMVESIY